MIRDGRLGGRLRRRTADITPVPAYLPQHRAGEPRVFPGVLAAPVAEPAAPAAAQPDPAPRPSFTGKRPSADAETRPHRIVDALGRVPSVRAELPPAIGDSIAVPLSFRPDPAPVGVALYAGPHWSRHYIGARVRDGKWYSPGEDVEAAVGRHLTEELAAKRRVREAIAARVRRQCAEYGLPGEALLRRTEELNDAARAAKAGVQ